MTLSGRTYPMDGPPAALDFTPNVADGVADAAENAACVEPAPKTFSGLRGPAPPAEQVPWATPLDSSARVRCCNLAKAVETAVGAARSPLGPSFFF